MRERVIYLVRHGETAWNAAGRIQGHLDSALTARGVAQADATGRRLAEALAGMTVAGHVSPLGRAKATAARIAQFTSIAFRDDPRLMEVSLGSWDGLSRDEIDAEHPGALDGADGLDWYYRSPDGETFEAGMARARSWLDDAEAPALAVSHGLTIRLIIGAYLGLPRRQTLALPVSQHGYAILRDGAVQYLE